MSLPVSPATIRSSYQLIQPYIRTTPLLNLPGNDEHSSVQFKLEHLQLSGTFKARGAFTGLLTRLARDPACAQVGVAAASGGNHGIAVATAAKALGVKAHIFVPLIATKAKVSTLQRLGATVYQTGDYYAQALEACQQFIADTGAMSLHAYDDVTTLNGQGTVALEWEQQRQSLAEPPLETVYVAVGGGGLIGGMAAWWSGRCRVIAVESQGCATYYQARQAGQPVSITVSGIAADSLGATRVGELMFPIAQAHVAEAIVVSDAQIQAAQTWAWQTLRIALEPGGATALAGWWVHNQSSHSHSSAKATPPTTGVLLCGANVNLSQISEQPAS